MRAGEWRGRPGDAAPASGRSPRCASLWLSGDLPARTWARGSLGTGRLLGHAASGRQDVCNSWREKRTFGRERLQSTAPAQRAITKPRTTRSRRKVKATTSDALAGSAARTQPLETTAAMPLTTLGGEVVARGPNLNIVERRAQKSRSWAVAATTVRPCLAAMASLAPVKNPQYHLNVPARSVSVSPPNRRRPSWGRPRSTTSISRGGGEGRGAAPCLHWIHIVRAVPRGRQSLLKPPLFPRRGESHPRHTVR